jgi:ATP-dependent Clp protease ATP-binding subunit ClpB
VASPSPTTTTLSLSRYAADAKSLVASAQALADERRHREVDPIHVLARALERNAGAREVLKRAVGNAVEFEGATEKALASLKSGNEPAYLSPAMLDLLERADREAARDRAPEVGIEHVLNALTQEVRGAVGEVLSAFGIGPGSLRDHMVALRSVPREAPKAATGYTRDLVAPDLASAGPNVIGRAHEVRRLLTILERRNKSHPLLVGEHGVGKKSIVRALARRMAQGDVPQSLEGTKLFEVDVGGLVAGARLRGEIEERVKRLIESARNTSGECILFVDSVEQLFAQGPTGSAVGDVLGPALARGDVRMLSTTTPEGVRRMSEKSPALLRLFTLLTVEEPSVEQATEIVRGIANHFEEYHRVRVAEGAIVAAVRLAKRYLQDRFLPDTAVDLLDETAAAKRVEADGLPEQADVMITRLSSLESQQRSLDGADDTLSTEVRARIAAEIEQLKPGVQALRDDLGKRRAETAAKPAEAAPNTVPADAPLVQEADVAKTLAHWTGIPETRMLEGEAEKLLKMEERLGQRVIGQDEAVGAIARAVRRGRVGLRDAKRPIGSFLFLGPSGVGKTELAKALAEFLFDDEACLTRLDMSEFMERHMAQRLIGAPPGYADADQGGFLTEAVRRRPYSVLLFDEVEKAHQDVFNLLLQVLDEGTLTDGMGRSADFSNTVVVMTSNIGSGRILETDARLFESDDGRNALHDVLETELAGFFRPEFLNRIDDVVVFRPLTREHLRSIVEIQLSLLSRMLRSRKLSLVVSDAAKQHLVALGYEPALGARPLKRVILKHLQDPLAENILRGGYTSGTKIQVELEGEALVFKAG